MQMWEEMSFSKRCVKLDVSARELKPIMAQIHTCFDKINLLHCFKILGNYIKKFRGKTAIY